MPFLFVCCTVVSHSFLSLSGKCFWKDWITQQLKCVYELAADRFCSCGTIETGSIATGLKDTTRGGKLINILKEMMAEI